MFTRQKARSGKKLSGIATAGVLAVAFGLSLAANALASLPWIDGVCSGVGDPDCDGVCSDNPQDGDC